MNPLIEGKLTILTTMLAKEDITLSGGHSIYEPVIFSLGEFYHTKLDLIELERYTVQQLFDVVVERLNKTKWNYRFLTETDKNFLRQHPDFAKHFLSRENQLAAHLRATRIVLQLNPERVCSDLVITPETLMELESGVFRDKGALKRLVALYDTLRPSKGIWDAYCEFLN